MPHGERFGKPNTAVPFTREEMAERLVGGALYSDLARDYCCSLATVWRWARTWGIRSRRSWLKIQDAEWRSLIEKSTGDRTLAKEIGCAKETVEYHRKRLHVDRRKLPRKGARKPYSLTPAERTEIGILRLSYIERERGALTNAEIMARFNVTRDTVYECARQLLAKMNGTEKPRIRPRRGPTDAEEIRRLVNQGWTEPQIAAKFGRKRRWARSWTRRLGIAVQRPDADARRELVLGLVAKGMRSAHIARVAGCTPQRVIQIRAQAGVAPRTRKAIHRRDAA